MKQGSRSGLPALRSPTIATIHCSERTKTLLNPSVREIVLALHFDEARDGALEFEGAVARDIDLLGRHLGRGHQQGARLVESIDQDMKALRLVALALRQTRDALNDNCRVALRQRQVIGGRQ